MVIYTTSTLFFPMLNSQNKGFEDEAAQAVFKETYPF